MFLRWAFIALPSPSFDPPGSSTFFYLQNEKNGSFLFCFRCPICLPPDWKSETRGKTFWCPWKTCGRAGATSGLAFDYPLKGRFPYILRFASVVYILIHRFHCIYVSTSCLQCISRGSPRVPKFIVDFVCAMRLLTLILPFRQVTEKGMRLS